MATPNRDLLHACLSDPNRQGAASCPESRQCRFVRGVDLEFACGPRGLALCDVRQNARPHHTRWACLRGPGESPESTTAEAAHRSAKLPDASDASLRPLEGIDIDCEPQSLFCKDYLFTSGRYRDI